MHASHLCAVFVATLGIAGCVSPEPVVPAPVVAPAIDWGWPSVAAPDGRSRFQLQVILRNGPYEAGGGPTLQVQGQVESDDQDLFLSDLYGKLRFAGDDGKQRTLDREHFMVDAAHRNVAFHGVDAGADPKRLQSLEVELRLVRVKSWARRTIANVDEIERSFRAANAERPPDRVAGMGSKYCRWM